MNKVLFSRNSDNWATPKVIYDFYIKNNYFDPCPLNSNFNGLDIEWKVKNFVNPPYSKIKEILEELKRRSERYNYCLKNDISFSDEDYQAYLLLDYITNLQEKYDKALEDSVKETHKLMAIRKYLKDNEREYGSLEDNEKIILGIIEGNDNE